MVRVKTIARREIYESLGKCDFYVKRLGLSFISKLPKTFLGKLSIYIKLCIASVLVFTKLLGEYSLTASLVATHVSLEDFIGSYLHIAGYDTMSNYLFEFIIAQSLRH
jgi:hypothetical protein